ncbi:MAG: FixH family protein [Syntrophales bacterium]
MKRVTVILAILFLTFGLAYAKNYEVVKKAGNYTVHIIMDKNPPIAGENNIEINIKDAAGADVIDAVVVVEYSMPAMPGMPAMNYKTKTDTKSKKYVAIVDFSMSGAWNINVKITRAGKTQSVKFNVDVS